MAIVSEAVTRALSKEAGLKLLFIDDNGHSEHYLRISCSTKTLTHLKKLYVSRADETRLLLGPRYALLRREFHRWGTWKRQIRDVGRKILITLEETAIRKCYATRRKCLSLFDTMAFEIVVVVGGAES